MLQFFFSSRRRHTRSTRDWSSDVCSSDLQHDVAGALLIWRHPEQAVELRVTGCGEGMRTAGINGLAGQQMHRLGIFGGQLIVRQVWMEIECWDFFEQT